MHLYTVHIFEINLYFKGIVSRNFGGLQMILMDRIGVPDVPLEVYFLFIFVLYSFLSSKFWAG